jgi:hypothetical protein
MSLRVLFTALVLVTAAGCTELTDAADNRAREAAKVAVTPIVEERYPGLPVAPIVDCVIQYAGLSEVLELARAATLGPTSETHRVVIAIVARPDTVRCIAQAQAEAFVAERIAS